MSLRTSTEASRTTSFLGKEQCQEWVKNTSSFSALLSYQFFLSLLSPKHLCSTLSYCTLVPGKELKRE